MSFVTCIVYQVLGPLNKENRGCASRGMIVDHYASPIENLDEARFKMQMQILAALFVCVCATSCEDELSRPSGQASSHWKSFTKGTIVVLFRFKKCDFKAF